MSDKLSSKLAEYEGEGLSSPQTDPLAVSN